MKHYLLSMVALTGAMFVSTSAWAVEPPQEVVPAYTEDWTTPADGGVYFIYNVGAAQFLGAGNNWGTHVVTATPEVDVVPVYYWNDAVAFAGEASSMNTGMILPFKLTKTDDEHWYIEHLGTNRADRYLSSEDGNSWIDCNAGRRIDFIITAVDGGFTIQASNTVEAATYFGAVDQDPAPDAGMTYVRNVMNNVTAENGHIIWKFAPTNYAAFIKYADVLALYEEIVAAEEYGVDASAAIAVYENSASTSEDLKLAISALKALVNQAKFKELWASASEDNPLDVTSDCLTNPDFETGDISGWVCTFEKGKTATNIGYQKSSYSNGDVRISKFIEAWQANAEDKKVIGDGLLYQAVYGLPKGKYVLEADVIAVDQHQGNNPVTGVYLYIQAGQYEAKQAVATGNALPEHFQVVFINDGSDELTFGLKTESATANWIAADNFTIAYYGESEQSIALATLNETLKKAEEIDVDGTYAEAAAKSAFSDALAKAESDIAANAGDEAYEADNAALIGAMTALEASIKVYEKLNALIESVSSTSEQVADQWPELADDFDAWVEEELQPAYEDGTYSEADITAAEAKKHEMIIAFIATPGSVKEGDKLTILIDNADFTNGTTGWIIENRAGGNFGTKFDGIEYPEIECWHGTFDVYQVIPNMPRGAYKLKVQGFSRNDDASVPPQPSTVELYAGVVTTKFMDIKDEYSLEPFTEEATNGRYKDQAETTGEGEPCYVPSGMASAQQFFMRENPMTGQPFYTNFIDVILAEDGDLRIGVRCSDKHSWVLYSNFELEYAGNNASAYTDQIRQLAGELADLATVDGAFITAKAGQLIDELTGKSEDIIGEADADKCIAFISELKDAIAYVEEGNAKGAELLNVTDIYNSYLVEQVPSNYYDFIDMLGNILAYADDASDVADNDAIDALIASLKKEWGIYVMYEVEASKDAPVDVTPAILNNDYANTLSTGEINSNFWTSEGANGANGGFAEIEFFNTNFKHFQKLEGLKEGYYAVSVDGFYRAGDFAKYTDDSLSIQNAYLFVESSLGNNSTGIVNLGTVAQESALGVGAEVELTTLTEGNGFIPNNMEAAMAYISAGIVPNKVVVEVGADGELTIGVAKDNGITNDWTIFSNWKLEYYGAGAENEPDAVRGIADAAATIQSIFSINGTQQQGLRRGVNIIRMSDGSVRKVLVK